MKTLNYMGENHQLRTEDEDKLYSELKRQFGKRDADMFILSPGKFKHHFDRPTLTAYNNI